MSFIERLYGLDNERSKKYECSCVDCGHKESYDDHCKNHRCSKCGGQMRRVSRPGSGKE